MYFRGSLEKMANKLSNYLYDEKIILKPWSTNKIITSTLHISNLLGFKDVVGNDLGVATYNII